MKDFAQLSKKLLKFKDNFLPVIVSDPFCNGLGQVRSLGKEGIKSLVVSDCKSALSFYSRFAIPYLCSSFTKEPEKLIKDLLGLGQRLKELKIKPVLLVIPMEGLLSSLIKNKEKLANFFYFSSDLDLQFFLEDKKNQFDLVEQAGLNLPKTLYLNSSLEINIKEIGLEFPFLVKGRKSKEFYARYHRQAIKVYNCEELNEILKVSSGLKLMLQEEIPGDDTCLLTLGSYMSKTHLPLGVFTGYKLRSSRDYGTAAMAISALAPDVVKQGLYFLQSIKYHGASQIEFKRDARDNKLKFIEINNRLWKWHSLSTYCGVNLTYLQFKDAIGQKITSSLEQKNGKRWWLPLSDTKNSLRRVLKKEMQLSDFIKTLSFDFIDGVGGVSDPLPGIINFFSFKW